MERRKMKKKGFTLVELLVVIAIIAMLLAILMPALGKVRQLAQRIMCSTNCAGLGKAMLTYSNDDKYESFPIGGASGAYWDKGAGGKAALTGNKITYDWRIPTFNDTAGISAAKYTTISSCLYLLVKIADTTPDQFICPGSDNKKFELGNYNLHNDYKSATFTDVWDFGNAVHHKTNAMGKGHNTYSYQSPLPLSTAAPSNVYPISTTSNPARPVMADRNPFWTAGNTAYLYTWDGTSKPYQASLPAGNSTYHQKDGQNVLYADLHVKFEKQANVGIQQDNIYTYWGTNVITTANEYARQCGKNPSTSGAETSTKTLETGLTDLQAAGSGTDKLPTSEDDSYLVSDVDNYLQ
jgi:prepilin-type N-terminal cleavage/methylation domain-containing protein